MLWCDGALETQDVVVGLLLCRYGTGWPDNG